MSEFQRWADGWYDGERLRVQGDRRVVDSARRWALRWLFDGSSMAYHRGVLAAIGRR